MPQHLRLFSDADCRWLDDHRWLAGFEIYREIDSTNRRALQCEPSLALPHLVITEVQTAGRGRGTNRWHGADGCLMFSLRLEASSLGLARRHLGILSLATGLAIRHALAEFLPGEPLQLKWPNDVYFAERKICGILLEMTDSPAPAVVIGAGINVSNSFETAPEDVQRRATSLAEHLTPSPSLRNVLASVLDSIEAEMIRVATGRIDLANRWHCHCYLRDKLVEIRQVTQSVVGRCRGVSENGELLVETQTRLHPVNSGEVVSVRN